MSENWTEHDLQVNGIRIHYTRTAERRAKTLVLVHGFSDNGRCWTPVARALESEYDIVMPDNRGHGLSARAHDGPKIDMASDLAELIVQLKLDKPILVGHSMGAMVVYELALRFPELVKALVLEDPAWFAQTPAPSDGAKNPVVEWARTLEAIPIAELLAQYRKGNPSWPEELLVPMVESKKQLDQNILDVLGRKMFDKTWYWRDTLPRLNLPLLLFWGDPAKGGIVSPETAAEVARLKPDTTLVSVPEAGHLIRFDRFDTFVKELRGFLARVENRGT